jgi:hypothetical protein
MGLLDDAIKEHLELKRKRGADPAEVAQQEREALGPVRGATDTATAEPPAAEATAAEPPPVAAEPEFHGAVRMPDPEPDPNRSPSRRSPGAARARQPADPAVLRRRGGGGPRRGRAAGRRRRRPRRRAARRGRARRDPGVPPGGARARPPLVRAASRPATSTSDARWASAPSPGWTSSPRRR